MVFIAIGMAKCWGSNFIGTRNSQYAGVVFDIDIRVYGAVVRFKNQAGREVKHRNQPLGNDGQQI